MTEPIRVTEVLDYFKEPWYVDWLCKVGKREANRISKAAMKVGTRVDEHIKKKPFSPDISFKYDNAEIGNAIVAYKKWLEVYKPKSVTPCTRLNATIDKIEVTGEPDLIVDDVLVDIKCSSKISPKYWVQVNMYRYLDRLSLNGTIYSYKDELKKLGKVAILRLDKNTASYEYVVKDYDPNLVDVWCGLAKAYLYLKGEEDGAEL